MQIATYVVADRQFNAFVPLSRVLCINYLAGFCPKGETCVDAHPKFELPAPEENLKFGKKVVITCHYCSEPGHKVSHCPNMPPELREQQLEKFGVGG